MEKMNDSLIKVLKKMCNIVHTDFNKIDFKDDKWFTLYSWTRRQEDRFKEWLSELVYTNSKVRNELSTCRKNKKDIKKFVDMFVFNYGWTIKG